MDKMSELKTLKEIEPELVFSGKEVRELGLKFSDMKKVDYIQHERDKKIREEAIKWINNENGLPVFPDMGGDLMILTELEQGYVRSWIKHFFNITEEDLKET